MALDDMPEGQDEIDISDLEALGAELDKALASVPGATEAAQPESSTSTVESSQQGGDIDLDALGAELDAGLSPAPSGSGADVASMSSQGSSGLTSDPQAVSPRGESSPHLGGGVPQAGAVSTAGGTAPIGPSGSGSPVGGGGSSDPAVSRAKFAPLREEPNPSANPKGIDLLLDITLQVTVELGRAFMTVGETLNLAPGRVIELDKLAGDPVDVLVNGTLIARGEVVVVEEQFGVRITEIVSRRERVEAMR